MSGGLNTTSLMNAAARAVHLVDGLNNSKHSRRLADTREQRSQEVHEIRKEEYEETKRSRNSQRAMKYMENQDALGKYAARQAALMEGYEESRSEEDLEIEKLFPQLKADYILSDEVGRAIEVGKDALKNPRKANTPEALNALALIVPEINAGADDDRKRTPAGVYPGKTEGTIVVDLAVEGEDTTKPLTEGRGSNDNDRVKEISVGQLTDKFLQTETYRKMLGSSSGRKALMKAYGITGSKGKVQHDKPYSDKHGDVWQRDSSGKVRLLKKAASGGAANAAIQFKVRAYKDLGYSDEDSKRLALADDSPDEAADRYARLIVNTEKSNSDPLKDPVNFQDLYKESRANFLSTYYQKQNEGEQNAKPKNNSSVPASEQGVSAERFLKDNPAFEPVLKNFLEKNKGKMPENQLVLEFIKHVEARK